MGKASVSLQQRQDAFLAALMTNATVQAAAKAANISEKTAYTYLSDVGFQREYQQRRDEALTAVSNTLRNSMSEAVTVVQDIMRDTDANSFHRLSAARLILEMSMRSVETVEIIQRLSKLEKMITTDNVQAFTDF